MKSATLSRPKKRSRVIRHRPPKAMVRKAAPAVTGKPEDEGDDYFARLYIETKEEDFEKPTRVVLGEKAFYIISEFEYRSLRETVALASNPEEYKKVLKSLSDPVSRTFDSVDDMVKDLESNNDWE